MKYKISKDTLFLFAILAAGLVLRIHNLDRESLWLDEGHSLMFSSYSLGQFIQEAPKDVHPPLYYELLHYWIVAFGASEYALRLLSVFFGCLCIYMIFRVGALLFDQETGLISAAILAVSTFHIQYSQTTKGLTLLTFLALLSFYFFIQAINKNSLKNAAYYIVGTTCLFYAHNYGVFIIIAQNIYFLALFLCSRHSLKMSLPKWAMIQFSIFLLFLPWIGILLKQVARVKSGYWLSEPDMGSLYLSFIFFAGSSPLLKIFAGLSLVTLLNIDVSLAGLKPGKVYASIKSKKFQDWLDNYKPIFMLIVWLVIPIALPFVISKYGMPIYHRRYAIIASVAFYMLAAKGIRNIAYQYSRIILVVLILSLSILSLKGYYSRTYNTQWREAVGFINHNAKSGDLVIVHENYCLKTIYSYYDKRSDLIKKPFPAQGEEVNDQNLKELDALARGHSRVWLVISHSLGDEQLIIDRLAELYRVAFHWQFFGIDLYLFEGLN